MTSTWWAAHSPHWNRTGVLLAAFGILVTVVGIVVPLVVTSRGGGPQSTSLRTGPAPRPTCPSGSAAKPRDTGTVYVVGTQRTPVTCWTPILAPVKPGQQLEYLITYTNVSRSIQQNVVFGAKLASGISLEPNTTRFYADSTPASGKLLSTNALTTSGVVLGSYTSGAGSYVAFKVVMPLEDALQCGVNDFRTMVSVEPTDVNYFYNTIETEVNRDC